MREFRPRAPGRRLYSGSTVRLIVRKLRRVPALKVGVLAARVYTAPEQEG